MHTPDEQASPGKVVVVLVVAVVLSWVLVVVVGLGIAWMVAEASSMAR